MIFTVSSLQIQSFALGSRSRDPFNGITPFLSSLPDGTISLRRNLALHLLQLLIISDNRLLQQTLSPSFLPPFYQTLVHWAHQEMPPLFSCRCETRTLNYVKRTSFVIVYAHNVGAIKLNKKRSPLPGDGSNRSQTP